MQVRHIVSSVMEDACSLEKAYEARGCFEEDWASNWMCN